MILQFIPEGVLGSGENGWSSGLEEGIGRLEFGEVDSVRSLKILLAPCGRLDLFIHCTVSRGLCGRWREFRAYRMGVCWREEAQRWGGKG